VVSLLFAATCVPACIMTGYDRAPLDHGVEPPSAGQGGGATSGAAGISGSGANAGSSATGRAGSSGSSGSAGSAPPAPVRDICSASNVGTRCDDGRKCTLNDTCGSDGYCNGTAMVCPLSLIQCSPIVCDEDSGSCINRALPDASPCGIGGLFRCVGGLCTSPQTCTTTACNADCEDDLSCLYQCPGSDSCSATCDPSAACFFDCTGGGTCTHTCSSDSSCRVDCSGADHCAVSCQAGASCSIECTGTHDCANIECAAGAKCGLTCSAGAPCAFKRCDAGQVSCGANMIGCGGCPL
jgi:hypothetical protein